MNTRDFLFELGTEELPPRTLLTLSVALEEAVVAGLRAAGIPHGATQRFATPRRLAVRIMALAAAAADRVVERRGPPVANSFAADGAPTQAALAFARGCGVAVESLERLTTDKGAWLVFRGTEPGASTLAVLGNIVNQAVQSLPIAKRMRWGARTSEFVRPVRSVVALYGEQIVPIEVLGLAAGRVTHGHRFLAPKPISLASPKGYEGRLRRAKVVADFAARRDSIRAGVIAAAAEAGGVPLIDEALLDEVTALVEWPVPIAGRFETRFLELPREVVIATVQEHQRYFPVQDAQGGLTGAFVTVSNIESRDPSKVREGNERVVRPRLSDAAFFWDQDRKTSLAAYADRLATVTFQTKLGSYADKTRRIGDLAARIGADIGAGTNVERAARLCKADLLTAMVGEFPELQGTMGRYYALAQGETVEVAAAIEEHYRPRYAGDALPASKTGQALALADKIDSIVGIFAIEQRPSGTKDPFGLRRAALGVLRILLEERHPLDLGEWVAASAAAQPLRRDGTAAEVREFFTERLRGVLLERTEGSTVEMLDAVLADTAGGSRGFSPLDIAARLEALRAFLEAPEAQLLTALNKRIANILKKTPLAGDGAVVADELHEAEEIGLYRALNDLRDDVNQAVHHRRYAEALRGSLGLRAAVNDFFERILVMDENVRRRDNRLALLREVRDLLAGVADLSRLPG